mgnify:FL=1
MKRKFVSIYLLICMVLGCVALPQAVAVAASDDGKTESNGSSEVIATAIFGGGGVQATGFESIKTGTGAFNEEIKKAVTGLSLVANVSNKDAYVYFNFDDGFAKEVSDGSVFDFEIEYYSENNAYFELRYDSVITEAARGELTEVGNDLSWKTVKYTVDDAFFGERLENGADFWLSAVTWARATHINRTTASPANPVIKSVKVTKHIAQKPVTVIAQTNESGNTFEWFKEQKAISNSVTNTFDEDVDVNITYKAIDQNKKTRWQQSEKINLKAKESIQRDVNVDTDYCSVYNYIVNIEIPSKDIAYEYEPFEFAIVKTDPSGISNDFMYWCAHVTRYKEEQAGDLMEMVKKSNSAGVRSGFERHTFGAEGLPAFNATDKFMIDEAKRLNLKLALILSYWSPWLSDKAITTQQAALSNVNGFSDATKKDMYEWVKVITNEGKDVLSAYEMWNEPNLVSFGFKNFDETTKGYFNYVKLMREYLNELDPGKPVLVGAYAGPYNQYSTVEKSTEGSALRFHELIVDMGIADYCDGVSFHPYNTRKYEDEEVFDKLNWYVDYMEQKSGKKNMVAWVTELGNPIGQYVETDEKQAYKNVRECLVNRSNRVNFNAPTAIYNLERLGPSSDREDNFGNIAPGDPKVLRKNARAFVPHDGYVSLTGMNYVLGNADFASYEKTDDNMWVEQFKSKKFNKNIAAIWLEDTEEQKTFDTGCGEITVFDPYGNETKLKSTNGKYTFTVSQTPFYIMGDFDSISECETVETKYSDIEVSVAQGDVFRFEITKGNAPDGATIEMQMPDFAVALKNEPFKDGKAYVEYSLTPGYDGTLYITGTVNENNESSQYIRVRLIVSDAIDASVTNKFPGGTDYNVWKMVFDITNKSLSNIAKGKIRINSPNELKGEYEFDIGNVLKSKTSRITVNCPEVSRKQLYYLDYDVILDNGSVYNFNQQLDFTIAPKRKTDIVIDGKVGEGEWRLSTAMISDSAENVKQIKDWAGPDDLSGYTMMQWDENKLYLFASITDDVFSNPNTVDRLWAGDSIQFGVYNPEYAHIAQGEGLSDFNEIGIALLKDGPAVYKFKDQYKAQDKIGQIKDCEVAVVRDEAAKKTNYEFAISWTSLFGKEMNYKTGDRIGYSVLYNDDDGSGRRGWIEYAGGIGLTKNTKFFTYLNLVD